MHLCSTLVASRRISHRGHHVCQTSQVHLSSSHDYIGCYWHGICIPPAKPPGNAAKKVERREGGGVEREKVRALGSVDPIRGRTERARARSEQNFNGGLSPSGDVVMTPQNLNQMGSADYDSFFVRRIARSLARSFVPMLPSPPSAACTDRGRDGPWPWAI